MEKYTSLDWRSPRPYLFLAAIFAVMTGLCYAARSSEGLGFFLSWYLAIDPDVTAKECAVGLMATAVLAASPSLRKIAVSGITWTKSLWNLLPAPLPATKPTWDALAGLRLVLAALVVWTHTCAFTGHETDPVWFFGNLSAVMGFFVISGYSIAASIERDRTHYATRRIIRIAPMYYAAWVFAWLPVLLYGTRMIGQRGGGVWGVILALIFVQGIILPSPALMAPFWSLGCEVAYYIAGPFLRKLSTTVLLCVMAASLTLYYLYNHSLFFAVPINRAADGLTMLCLLWAWLGGFLLYRGENTKAVLLALMIGAIGSGLPPLAVYIIFIAYAPALQLSERLRNVCRYGGEISYPLYLLHWTCFLLIMFCAPIKVFLHNWAVILVWVLALSLSIAFYHLIDKPIRRRRKLKDATSPASTQAEPTGSPLKAPS